MIKYKFFESSAYKATVHNIVLLICAFHSAMLSWLNKHLLSKADHTNFE